MGVFRGDCGNISNAGFTLLRIEQQQSTLHAAGKLTGRIARFGHIIYIQFDVGEIALLQCRNALSSRLYCLCIIDL